MAARNRITTTILSTLIAGTALLGGAQSAVASVPDPVSTIGLRALAAEFGDSFGHIVSTDENGQPVVLARLVRVYEVYTAGDQIYVNDQFAFCHEDQAGGLSSCEPLEPGLGDYTCGWNEIQSWCSCEGLVDCFDMIANGPCDEDAIVCDGQGCECDAWSTASASGDCDPAGEVGPACEGTCVQCSGDDRGLCMQGCAGEGCNVDAFC